MQSNNSISLLRLVSTCADACTRGCKVIRSVHTKRCSSSSTTLGVSYKEKDDPRSALTEADVSSQKVILACLRNVWGEDLRIIGEEDSDEEETQAVADAELFQKYNIPNLSEEHVKTDILYDRIDEKDGAWKETNVPLSDVTLYIDPMDGTREFVEGRIQNVQCLIGITVKNKPVGGVIGLPFVSYADQNEETINVICAIKSDNCTLVENICLGESLTSPEPWLQFGEKATTTPGSTLTVYTGDSQRVQKKHALNFLENAVQDGETDHVLDVCITGGCGNKIFRTTAASCRNKDGNAISLIPPGTCSWDTAASTAFMLASMGKFGKQGKITDYFGGELVYDSTGKRVKNDLGAIISCGDIAVNYHDRLTDAMSEDGVILNSMLRKYWNAVDCDGGNVFGEPERTDLKVAQNVAQAIGFIRNESGYVMTSKDIENIIRDLGDIDESFTLMGYSIPKKHFTRTSEEITGRIDVFWKDMKGERIEPLKYLSYSRQLNQSGVTTVDIKIEN